MEGVQWRAIKIMGGDAGGGVGESQDIQGEDERCWFVQP